MSTLAIVYHADADGAASAALVYHLYAEIIPKETKTPVPDIIFIRQGSKNYGKVAPLEDIPEGADVIVVDYSYDEEELLKLKARAGSFQLYDHHKSAEEKLAHIEGCVFDCSVGGVEVVWNELYLKKISELNLGLLKSDHYRKCVVKIVGECDIYRFDYPECQIFIAGIAALGDITSPSWMSEVFNKWESIESEVWSALRQHPSFYLLPVEIFDQLKTFWEVQGVAASIPMTASTKLLSECLCRLSRITTTKMEFHPV